MTTAAAMVDRMSTIKRITTRAPSYWRYLCEQPSWLVMFLFARTLTGRRMERWVKRAAYRTPEIAKSSLLGEVDLSTVMENLMQDGLHLGLTLPKDVVRDIRAFTDANLCYARDDQTTGFLHHDVQDANRLRDRDVVAAYYFDAVERSTAITALGSDPVMRSIAKAYLGHEPVLIRIRLWWSFPARRVSDADLHAAAQDKFHFDMNGWRTLKFFFYLTATDKNGGAHQCVLGSHRHRALRHQLTFMCGREEAELRDFYDPERFLTITGSEGEGFVEDPFIFHTGSLCRDGARLILELEYGPTTVSPSYRYGRLG